MHRRNSERIPHDVVRSSFLPFFQLSILPLFQPTSLDNLVDIVAPPPVPWWPPAPGWFVVAGVLLVAAIALLIAGVSRWRANAYRREALRELDALERESAGNPQRLTALPELVKRTALAAWPREIVAGLSGDAWREFLDRSGRTTQFTNGAGAVLPDLAYDPGFAARLEASRQRELFAAARHWIERHESHDEPSKVALPC